MEAAARSAGSECTKAGDESDVLATVSLNYVQPSRHSINEGVVTLASYQSVSYRRGRVRQLVRHSFVRSDENERTRTR